MNKSQQILILLMINMLVLWGCAKKEDVPVSTKVDTPAASTTDDGKIRQTDTESVQQAAQTVTFDKVLDAWNQGQKEQASKLFLGINWTRSGLFADGSVLKISEAEFAKLPMNEQQQVRQQATQTASTVREIARYIVAQAKQSKEQTDVYRQALLACGQRLSEDDQLALIQLVGKAIIDYTKKELTTNN